PAGRGPPDPALPVFPDLPPELRGLRPLPPSRRFALEFGPYARGLAGCRGAPQRAEGADHAPPPHRSRRIPGGRGAVRGRRSLAHARDAPMGGRLNVSPIAWASIAPWRSSRPQLRARAAPLGRL